LFNRAFIAATITVTVPAIALVANAQTQFRDIPDGHWAKRVAGIMADRGVMPGRTRLDFAGDAPVTRYELAKVLSEIFNVIGPPSTFIVLSDMMPGHVATQEVQRVIGYELLGMRKPGFFMGDQPANRQEIVLALDTVFAKNGISPPARKTNAIFSDVKPSSPLGQALDRIVNRFGLFDAKPLSPFYPNSSLPRYSLLAMLVRAMPYLNPQIAAELKPPTPPPASRPPGSSPVPEVSLEPGASPTPTPSATPQPLLVTRGRALVEPVFMFSEDTPTDVGAAPATEQKAYSGAMLIGGGIDGEYWSGPLGGLLQVGSYYLPLTIASSNVDLLDTHVQLGGLYKVGTGPDWEFAVGGAGTFRYTYNLNATLLGQYYMTADKTYFGAGPAAAFGLRATPELTITGTGLVYPIYQQSYNLGSNNIGLSRWAADLSGRAEYALSPTLFASAGAHTFLSGGYTSGMQTYFGATLGVGSRF
jgi:hypothetical protein